MYSRSTYGGGFPTPEYLRSRYKVPEHYDGVAFSGDARREGTAEQNSAVEAAIPSARKSSMQGKTTPISFSGTAEQNFSADRAYSHSENDPHEAEKSRQIGEKALDGEADEADLPEEHEDKASFTEEVEKGAEESEREDGDENDAALKKPKTASSFLPSRFDGDDLLLASIVMLLTDCEEKGENDDLILLLIFLMFLH